MESDIKYYNGDRLRNSVDINGNRPEIFIVESNRTAGKTTDFAKFLIDRFIKHKEKFAVLVRWQYEAANFAEAFFKSVQGLFFPTYELTQQMIEKKYCELYLNDNACGYLIPINSAEFIKRRSHLFNDITSIFFDEIQPENNGYVPDELNKFFSIHTSIARGEHQQVRYVPVYMCSNSVSLLNPYYNALGVVTRLNSKTKFLRGDGWVLERNFNESAQKAQKSSGFNRAFSAISYSDYSAENVYLRDNDAFLTLPKGRGQYIATIRYDSRKYAIWLYPNDNIMTCDYRIDEDYPIKISATVQDHTERYTLIGGAGLIKERMRRYFINGNFRFKDLACKSAVLMALSYK